MVDLALNAIEIADRNLYERTTTTSAGGRPTRGVVDCAAAPTASVDYACKRLGVILSSYVYLDLWLHDLGGRVSPAASGSTG
jgi:hypothetical protein